YFPHATRPLFPTRRFSDLSYEVEDTASLHFEYPERLVTMFFTWAARRRENRIRFVGDRGAIERVGGELRLERAVALEPQLAAHRSEEHTSELQLRCHLVCR